MAFINKYVASVTLRDGVQRDSVVSVYVSEADAEAFITAADDLARSATNVGVFFASVANMSDAQMIRQSVTLERLQDTFTDVPDTALRGNKLVVEFTGEARNFIVSVPARKPSAFSQVQNSLEVDLDSPAALTSFVTAFETVAKTINGASVSVRRIRVAD